MSRCVCGGLYSFCKAFKNGKFKDIHTFRCACGCYLYVKDGVIWDFCYPIDLDKMFIFSKDK